MECLEAADELSAVRVAAEERVRRILLLDEAPVVLLLGFGHVGARFDDMEREA